MIILTVSEVADLHEKLIAATGGSYGIDLYPTAEEKAARMAFSICKNHPFIDGNKRTAVTSMLVILRMNGIALSFTQLELVAFGLGVAEGRTTYEDIVAWIHSHQ